MTIPEVRHLLRRHVDDGHDRKVAVVVPSPGDVAVWELCMILAPLSRWDSGAGIGWDVAG